MKTKKKLFQSVLVSAIFILFLLVVSSAALVNKELENSVIPETGIEQKPVYGAESKSHHGLFQAQYFPQTSL